MTTEENLKDQLLADGLKSGKFLHPLKKFTGKVSSYTVSQNQFKKLEVKLQFVGIKDIECHAGFTYDIEKLQGTAEIPITYSESENSRWGVFVGSIKKLSDGKIPKGFDETFNQVIKDKELTMSFTTGHNLGKTRNQFYNPELPESEANKKSLDNVVDAWEVTSLEKIVVTDILTYTKNLLNGKTASQFYQLALTDKLIQANPVMYNSIMNQEFVKTLVANGQAVLNSNQTYTVK